MASLDSLKAIISILTCNSTSNFPIKNLSFQRIITEWLTDLDLDTDS